MKRILNIFLLLLMAAPAVYSQRPFKMPAPLVIGRPGPQAPIVDAGDNQTTSGSTATLTGDVSCPGCTVTGYLWTQQSGPNTAGITTPTLVSTGLTGMVEGTYVFRLTVTNNLSLSAYDEVTVYIVPASFGDTVFVYLSAGQSNEDGRALDSFPYANAQLQVPGVQVFNWPDRTMRPFEYDRYNGGSGVSSARWAGDIIVCKKVFDSLRSGTGDSVVLLKATLGATALNPSSTYAGSWCIPQDSVTGVGDARMFDTLTNRYNDFKAMWNGRGYYVKVVCLMWSQGESDNLAGGGYYPRQEALFSAIRTLVGEPNLKILIQEIVDYSSSYNATVEAAKTAVADDVDIFYILMDGQPLKADMVHWGATGQTYYGNSMYSKVKVWGR